MSIPIVSSNYLCKAMMILFCLLNMHPANAQFVRSIYSNELIKGPVSMVTEKSLYKRGGNAVDTNVVIINYNQKGETTSQQIRKHYDTRFIYTPVATTISQEWDVLFTYQYNKAGDVTMVVAKRQTGKNISKFNKQHQLKENYNYDINNKIVERSYYSYTPDSNLAAFKLYDTQGKYHLKQEYKYDSRGLQSEEIVINIGASTHRFRYEYLSFDKYGNWTKRLRFLDNENDPGIELREIKYAE